MNFPDVTLQLLKETSVIDSNGNHIGDLDDIIIRISNPNKITKIVVSNPDEASNFKHLFEDNSLIIPLEFIEGSSIGVIKVTYKQEVIDRLNQDVDRFNEGEFLFSEIISNEVQDSNGQKIGRVKKIFVGEDPGIVIGDGLIEEILEDLGLETQTDIITSIDEIQLIEREVLHLKQDKQAYEKILKDDREGSLTNQPPVTQYPFRVHPIR